MVATETETDSEIEREETGTEETAISECYILQTLTQNIR